ncbi:MAG: hypothetical protein JOZ47_12075 [Kutzneria sp.]|nr:hypothetical protein [Kutzneria sp.]
MATTEEIQRRVEQADTARSAQRSAAAAQVGELAARRAAIAEQLADIERELGDVLAAAQDVIDIDELARFTDVPAPDLTRWLTARTTTRTKRKRPTGGGSATKSDPSRRPAAARTPAAGQTSTRSEPAVARTDATEAAETPARVPAEVA